MTTETTMSPERVNETESGAAVHSSALLWRSIAILYARPDSIYKTLEGCDVWDATRDARKFLGGMPVVAHPPCRAWCALAHLAKPRPDEKDLGRHAVKVVRECGGVLEHPISSRLWVDQKLPQPGERDAWGGYTLIMPQWWFGHRAEKWTRFYIVGVAMKDLPEVKLKLGDAPCVVTTSKRKCQTPPVEWRERLGNREKEATPLEMAQWLVAVARLVGITMQTERQPIASSETQPLPMNHE